MSARDVRDNDTKYDRNSTQMVPLNLKQVYGGLTQPHGPSRAFGRAYLRTVRRRRLHVRRRRLLLLLLLHGLGLG